MPMEAQMNAMVQKQFAAFVKKGGWTPPGTSQGDTSKGGKGKVPVRGPSATTRVWFHPA